MTADFINNLGELESYTKEVRKVLTVGGRKSLDKKHGKEEIEKLIAAWKAEPLLPEIGKEIESFMQISSGNKKVVFTAIFGNYDNLKTPEYINPDWDYVCFTDNKNVESDVFINHRSRSPFYRDHSFIQVVHLLLHLATRSRGDALGPRTGLHHQILGTLTSDAPLLSHPITPTPASRTQRLLPMSPAVDACV